MDKKSAIILGGTIPHKYLIDNLKKRGFYTILIDYYQNPPAAANADEHIQESTMNKEAVLAIAYERKASLVISGCIDQANITACYVLEKLGLHVPYSYKASLRVTDKELMKEGLDRARVPTAKYDILNFENSIIYSPDCYPKVVKPCDANGSKGVRKVVNDTELRSALEQAFEISRTKKVIIEDYIKGTEISVYCYINDNNKATILFIKSKKLPNINKNSALQSFFSLGPYNATSLVKGKIIKTIELISKEFDLVNTPLLLQAIVDDTNLDIIEFAPRVGGGLAFREMEYQTGYNIIDAVINSYLGIPLPEIIPMESGLLSSVTHFYGTSGILERVEGLEELVAKDIIKEFHLHKTRGMIMTTDDLASRNRVFGVIVIGKSIDEIKEKLCSVVDSVRVINTKGEDVLLRVSFKEMNNITMVR